jgi:hypothetical protein
MCCANKQALEYVRQAPVLRVAFGDNCTVQTPAGKVVSADNAEAVPRAVASVDREKGHEVNVIVFVEHPNFILRFTDPISESNSSDLLPHMHLFYRKSRVHVLRTPLLKIWGSLNKSVSSDKI